MKYQHLLFSIAFGATGLYGLIAKGSDYVYGWITIFLSCGFAILFIRDITNNAQTRKIFSILAKIFLWGAVLYFVLSRVVLICFK